MMEPASTIPAPSIRGPVDRPRAAVIRSVAFIGAVLATTLLLVLSGASASAAIAPLAINQCNGTDNVGGQAVACDVTVTNNLNLASGLSSSVVTVRECHGAANTILTCTSTTTPSSALVTSVTQCNGSGSGGGGTVTCTVHIVNNITGSAATTPATIDQCNGSGTGGGTAPTTVCSPIGSTTNATLTQCNNSGNGGGGSMRVQCTITTSTQTAVLPVTVNQCVGSGNGGGATVTCTASLINNVVPAAVTTAPVTTAPGTTAPGTTAPGTKAPVTRTGAGSSAAKLAIPLVAPSNSQTAVPTPGTPASPAGPGGPPTSLALTGAPVGILSLTSLTAILAGGAVLLLARPRRSPRRH